MKKQTALCACIALLFVPALADDGVPYGHEDFRPSRERPFGWRGDGTGRFPGANPVTSWNLETGSNVLWTAKLPGSAHASVIIAGNRLITVNDPTWIICHDKMTGEELWRRDAAHKVFGDEFRGSVMPRNQFVKETYRYTCPTPVTDGELVWYNFGHGAMVCYDLDGNLRWAQPFPVEGKQRSGISQSPALAGDTVVMGAAAKYAFAGFDADTGARLWKMARGGGVRGKGSFVPLSWEGKPYVLVSDGFIFHPRTGKIMQKNILSPKGGRAYGPTPNFCPELGLIFARDTNGKTIGAVPVKLDGESQKHAWMHPAGGYQSPLCHDGLLYQFGKTLKVYEAASGELVYEQAGLPRGWPSAALGGEYMYLLPSAKRADAVVFKAGREYEEVARFKVHFPGMGAKGGAQLGVCPVFDGDRIYYRDGGKLYCFGPTSGKPTKHWDAPPDDVRPDVEQLKALQLVEKAGTDFKKLIPLLNHDFLVVRLTARQRFLDLIQPMAGGASGTTACKPGGKAGALKTVDGIPVNSFTHGLMPMDWIIAGPFPGFTPRTDALAGLGGGSNVVPKVGMELTFHGKKQVFRKLDEKSVWTDRTFTANKPSLDLTHALAKKFNSTAVAACVVSNDKPRWVTFNMLTPGSEKHNPRHKLDGKAWLGGTPIEKGLAVKLEPGLYPLVVQVAMGKTVPWGRIWAAPSLAELPNEAVATSGGGDASGAAAIFRDALKRPEWRVRYNALWVMSKMGLGAAPFRELIEGKLTDDVSDVQALACRLITRLDEPTVAAVRGLMVALDDEFAGPEADRALGHLLRDAAPARKAAAQPVADALFETGGRRQNKYVVLALKAGVEIPFERLKEEYLKSPEHHWYFLGMVIQHGPYKVEEVLPFAIEELRKGREKYIDWHLAIICKGLVKYGPKAAPAVPVLIPLLKHSDNDTREHAAGLLGAIGPLAHKALPELERLAKEDPNEKVRGVASAAAWSIKGPR